MAHWRDVAVTKDGIKMLNEMMAGCQLRLTSAYGGTGVVDAAVLGEQTAMADQKQKLALVDEQDSPEGKTVTVQISSAGNSEEYLLRQIGVYATLDVAGAEGKLLFLMQDEGVVIPAETEESFLLEIYCTLRIGKDAKLTVTIDPAGLVTLQRMKDALDKHRTLWDEGDPTIATVGTVGQHYLNILTKKEFVCVSAGEEGYVWQVVGANIADDLTCGGQPLTEILGAVEPAEGAAAPTEQTAGIVGQKYTDTSTGTVYTCIAVSLNEDGGKRYTWAAGSLGTLAEIRASLHTVSAALEHKANITQLCNRNLLDNAYFVGGGSQKGAGYLPINQRGQTTYTGPGYSIDGLYATGPLEISLVEDGIKIYNPTEEIHYVFKKVAVPVFHAIKGATLTLSLLCRYNKDGFSLYFGYRKNGVYTTIATSGYPPVNNTAHLIAISGVIPNAELESFEGLGIRIPAKGTVIAAAAQLEIGTTQTLAHKEGDTWVLNAPPPNYALELVKCQRYFRRMISMGAYDFMALGLIENTDSAKVLLPIPSTMRINPAISFSGEFTLVEAVGNPFTQHPVTSMALSTYHDGICALNIKTSDVNCVVGTHCFLMGAEVGAHIDFNAES